MPGRALRNAKKDFSTVANNKAHMFSAAFALSIYPLNAVYTFIPKNACSTLRFSLAVANGFLNDLSDVDWIHNNNTTFIASQKEVAVAEFTFVILRCPFRRLVSCFLEKFSSETFRFVDGQGQIVDANFEQFINVIQSQKTDEMDLHWRPQVDFLHYENYDYYFNLENFSEAARRLKLLGFNVIDTRKSLMHDKSHLEKCRGDYSKIPVSEIIKMREKGLCPSDDSFYNENLYKKVQTIYWSDIEFYQNKFGPENILKI